MIVILLIIIVCVLLFGKDATKSGIGSLLGGILFLAIIAMIASACGIINAHMDKENHEDDIKKKGEICFL